jgi:F0F1-type ATP synthase assembly protein I
MSLLGYDVFRVVVVLTAGLIAGVVLGFGIGWLIAAFS